MFFPRRLALPALLALMAGNGGPAWAAIANGVTSAVGSGNSNSSGELFLNVWDDTAAWSYSLDLGTTVEQFLANPAARTWNLDQRFKDFAAQGHPLHFNIAANNTYGGIAAAGLGAVPSTYGVLSSVLDDPAATALADARTGTAGTNVQQYSSPVQTRINALNLQAAAQNGLIPGDPVDMARFDLNLGETTDANNDVYGGYFATLWGVNLSNRFAFSTTATVRDANGAADQTVRLYFFGLQGPGVNKVRATDLGGGSLRASLDTSQATLVWSVGGSGGPGGGASCEQLAWAGSLADGESIVAYSVAHSADCPAAAKTLTCTDGVLAGSDIYNLPSCADTACTLPWGGKLDSGQSVTAYQAATSVACVAETRVCSEGVLSGSFGFSACAAPLACVLPWGGSLADGQSVTAYVRKLDSDCAAGAEVRSCRNGVLNGRAAFATCTAPDITQAAGCALPWGGSLGDGQSVTAYQIATSAECPSAAEVRTCANGVLDGGYIYPGCSAPTGPYIELLFPKGGETLVAGRKQAILWDSGLIAAGRPATVWFSRNGGGTWKRLKSGVKIGRATLAWRPSAGQRTEAGLIRVCLSGLKAGAAVCGKSAGVFSVRRR